MLQEGTKHDRWFLITWRREDDLYKAAKLIPGAKYIKPYVIVPPEQFQSVLDFAEQYLFLFSEPAQTAVHQQRKALSSTPVVNMPKPRKDKPVAALSAPARLEVPEEVDIDESLRDYH